jgi:hypothetical protein
MNECMYVCMYVCVYKARISPRPPYWRNGMMYVGMNVCMYVEDVCM